ncbi:hypothetical protein CWE21_10855 [Pseudidiomarina aquimaris]|uniref:Polysaccharide biosynthesis protein C-terminal domain-containing protein n=1 Tax=Pseudidiomarina aquimaris TaxID=641841 RepID=A0A432XDD1_9GAMM|nr:hypothetical protein [Pseudidiomarina aquimaris]RUO46646.1 hypothetical protein CWE21_10855 [Pseudidiomarina aquimaris]
MKALASLFISIAPGAFRILVVWLAAHLYTPQYAAPFTAMYLFATALCMISGGGFGLVLIRHSAGSNRKSKVIISLFLLITGAVTAVLMTVVTIPFLQFELLPFLGITTALSCWQIERHGWIAERKFMFLSLLDLLLVIILVLTLWTSKLSIVTALVSSHVVLITVSFLWRFRQTKSGGHPTVWSWSLIWSAIKIGGSTFIAGGFLMILPALVESMITPIILTKLSLMVTAVGALFVVPRSYLNLFIGSLAKVVRARKVDSRIVHTCVRRIHRLGLIMLIPAYLFVLFYLIVSGQQLTPHDLLLSMTVCSAMVIGQLYLVEGNLLILLQRENIALISSSVMFVVMLGLAWLLGQSIEHDYKFLIGLFTCLGLCYSVRWGVYLTILKPYFQKPQKTDKVTKS